MTLNAFAALLDPLYQADGPGGAVLVMRGDEVLFRKGYGLASVELEVPIQPGMVFRIGSVTKQFTAAVVLLLAEEGLLDLDAPLRRYLPELPEAWDQATVEQALNHTAGIPDWVCSEAFTRQQREPKTPLAVLLQQQDQPLDFRPGTRWAYSNMGYLGLGLLIERVSGLTYHACLGDRILRPLGLTRTGSGDEKELIPGLVAGYTDGPKPARYIDMAQPRAAGDLVSNVDDLARWTRALHGGRVLKPASYARMVHSYPLAGGGETRYGFGLALRESQGRRLVGHSGGINGFLCMLEADPQAGIVAVILNNADARRIDDSYVSRRLLGLACGRPVQEPMPITLAPEHLRPLVGRFQGPTSGVRQVVLKDGQLVYRADAGPDWAMAPLSATEFILTGTDGGLRFVVEEGKVTGIRRFETGGSESELMLRADAAD